MRLPAEIKKVRHQRFRKRAADLEDRKPFARFPWWLRLLSSIPFPVWYGFASVLAFLMDSDAPLPSSAPPLLRVVQANR